MAQMLEPKAGETIYDPTCGTGGMLISCLAEVKRNGGDTRTIGLFGQELVNITAAIARMNLVLHGVSDFDIRSGNTLREPALIEGDRLKTFDVVLANPPYSIKKWNREAWQSDQWERNFLGTPAQGRADYAFFQHILKSMDPKTGRCAILFPHGVLFRKAEAELRRNLVATDMVECVLGLGPSLFYNSPMEACVVICHSQKPKGRQGKTLFIDAVHEIARENTQSFLRPEHQSRILDAFQAFKNETKFSAVATTDEILAKNGDLTVHHFVVRRPAGSAMESTESLVEGWDRLDSNGREFWLDMDELVEILDDFVAVEAKDA